MKYAISLDWFQYYCHDVTKLPLLIGRPIKSKSGKTAHGAEIEYQICDPEEKSAIYNHSYTIKYRGVNMVHVHRSPRSSALNPMSASVKVANRLLYTQDWAWWLHDIIDTIGFKIKNITRIDLCCDIQQFANGMKPNEFISAYLHNTNDGSSFIRRGSNKHCIYGEKICRENEENKELMQISQYFDYIRWGSRDSGVCTYLYNKSQELRDKKSKPWIQERWKQVGFDEKDGDIFRIEFSINSKGMQLSKEDKQEGMESPRAKKFYRISRDDVELQRNVEHLFTCYAHKYFSFKILGKQKYRKDMKNAVLLEFDIQPKMLPRYVCHAINVGAREKHAAATLQRILWQYQDLNSEDQKKLAAAINVLEFLGVTARELKKRDFSEYTYIDDITSGCVTDVQIRQVTKFAYEHISKALRDINHPRVAEMLDMLQQEREMAREEYLMESSLYQMYLADGIDLLNP